MKRGKTSKFVGISAPHSQQRKKLKSKLLSIPQPLICEILNYAVSTLRDYSRLCRTCKQFNAIINQHQPI